MIKRSNPFETTKRHVWFAFSEDGPFFRSSG
jgi:hypothetical protein